MVLFVSVKISDDDIELNLENVGIELEYLLPLSLNRCYVSSSDSGKSFFSHCNKLLNINSVNALLDFFFEESPYEFAEDKIEELNNETFDEEMTEEVIDELKVFYDQLSEIDDFSNISIITIESSDECDDPCKNNWFRVTYNIEDKVLNTEEHYYIDNEETTEEKYIECN